MTEQIIKRFHAIEMESGNHSEDYLEEIAEQTTLEDLIETVAMWVRACYGDRHVAAMYILNTLDREDD